MGTQKTEVLQSRTSVEGSRDHLSTTVEEVSVLGVYKTASSQYVRHDLDVLQTNPSVLRPFGSRKSLKLNHVKRTSKRNLRVFLCPLSNMNCIPFLCSTRRFLRRGLCNIDGKYTGKLNIIRLRL